MCLYSVPCNIHDVAHKYITICLPKLTSGLLIYYTLTSTPSEWLVAIGNVREEGVVYVVQSRFNSEF